MASVRSTPDWPVIVNDLQDALREALFSIRQSQASGVESHVIALNVLDQIDSYLTALKRELGV